MRLLLLVVIFTTNGLLSKADDRIMAPLAQRQRFMDEGSRQLNVI